ncbi:hypothetical protein H1P_1100002 [Hyella patelloides LEGE 07179]|uniref:Uncharacterized protein n=1 Tax=Hyella patelloides LEGE 07179 TaxID=945734 RepID=A0A563VJL4_9CYAN|nr:hypothetical protein H1P_1100002 [Hyella patelloides LEGE 07179]
MRPRVGVRRKGMRTKTKELVGKEPDRAIENNKINSSKKLRRRT